MKPWHRELLELAALFLAVWAAHLFASSLGEQSYGSAGLVALAVLLVVGAGMHRWWAVRRQRGIERADQPISHDGERTILRIRTTVPDRPGRLAAVSGNLARLDVNILSLQVHPLGDAVVDELLVDAPASLQAARLAAAVTSAGGSHTRVDRADRHDLVDVPTWVLTLAKRVAADTGELTAAVGDLLGGCDTRWVRRRSGARVDARVDGSAGEGTTLRIPHPDGGVLVVSRPQFPFTPDETARAWALVDLAARTVAATR